jgi:uncharacterized secreted protein with C-terminal beta-propeller domain
MRKLFVVPIFAFAACAGSHRDATVAVTQKTIAAFALPEPPRGIIATMTGDPSPADLEQARLVATTCDALEKDEVEAEIAEMRKAVDASLVMWADQQPYCTQTLGRGTMWGDTIGDSFGAGGLGLTGTGTIGHGAGSARLARDFSRTNNQVDSVDEADIVKTDGRWVYLASNGALRIVEALKPSVLSVTHVPGVVRELFVEGNRAVVYSSSPDRGAHTRCRYGYDCTFGGDGTTTSISVYDVSDRSSPKLARQLDLSGSLMAARRIGNAVHTVVADNDSPAPRWQSWPADLALCGAKQPTVAARLTLLKAENERAIRAHASRIPTITENGKSTRMCSGLARTALRDGDAFTSIVSFDLTDDHATPTTATMQSRPGAVFASESGLYVSVVHRKNDAKNRWYSYYEAAIDEVSEIHKFRIGPSASATKYVGSGTIPGHVLNQLAMDEWFGYLRVATTKGRVPDPNVESAVSILAETPSGALTRVGAISHIAPGEDIRAVRFDNERGYVVTFKKTDPLFVIDTLAPQQPKILGELKIPGFSTYLHRIDAEHLLSIGFDANDHGSFAYFDGIILQLFDVKDPTVPKLLHKEKIGTRGSSSEAATDHLAFNYLPSRGLLAIPMTICNGGGDGSFGDTLAFSGLVVYRVDVGTGFERLGGVDHGTKNVTCSRWWSQASSQVKRSIFLDELVYSIADDRVKVQDLEHLGHDVADLPMSN